MSSRDYLRLTPAWCFDKRVKEDYQCNYRSNTKEGPYTEWYRNGRKRYQGDFSRGQLKGASTAWYESGQMEAEENRLKGKLHGRVRYWSEKGDMQFDSTFDHGMNLHRRNVSYIDKNIDKLIDIPVWAFHGKMDTVVPFEETERIVKRLEGRKKNLRFSAEPDLGHSIHSQIYPGQQIYDWFLRYDKRSRK